jgi:hypothetical protein
MNVDEKISLHFKPNSATPSPNQTTTLMLSSSPYYINTNEGHYSCGVNDPFIPTSNP